MDVGQVRGQRDHVLPDETGENVFGSSSTERAAETFDFFFSTLPSSLPLVFLNVVLTLLSPPPPRNSPAFVKAADDGGKHVAVVVGRQKSSQISFVKLQVVFVLPS